MYQKRNFQMHYPDITQIAFSNKGFKMFSLRLMTWKHVSLHCRQQGKFQLRANCFTSRSPVSNAGQVSQSHLPPSTAMSNVLTTQPWPVHHKQTGNSWTALRCVFLRYMYTTISNKSTLTGSYWCLMASNIRVNIRLANGLVPFTDPLLILQINDIQETTPYISKMNTPTFIGNYIFKGQSAFSGANELTCLA